MRSRWIRITGTALGAIILGAIGSGLWSELLAPTWNLCLALVVKLFAYSSDSFRDSIYLEAAKGFHEKHSLAVLTLTLALIAGVYTGILMMLAFYRYERPKNTIRRFMKSEYEYVVFSFFAFVALTSIVMIIFIAIHSSYSNKVTTNSLNSIEIVAPYLGIEETLQLRSQFYSIKTRRDYDAFYSRMRLIGEKNKLDLPLSMPL